MRSELMLDLRPLFYEVLVEAEVVSGSNPLKLCLGLEINLV